MRRAAPTLIAALGAVAYLIAHPMSLDLAAHLLRAKLFSAEGFGLWNNWWYDGHHVPGYSVLFPPLAAAHTPQLAGALAAPATAAAFEAMAHDRFGRRAWLGSVWFGAATATELFTGRLAFAFGLLPATLAVLALQRERRVAAPALGAISALASPVAALFTALAGAAAALPHLRRNRRHAVPGLVLAGASLLPVALLSILFPEGGTEPFAAASLVPLVAICAIALVALPAEDRTLRAGALLYLIALIAADLIASPVGGNAARLGPLIAGPVVALIWWPGHRRLLALVVLPLLYLQWQPAVRDVRTAAGDPSGTTAYWQPLLSFLDRQPHRPFRVEIPFTQFHMEALRVAPSVPLPRGWERQVDIRDNPLFYDGSLSATSYAAWLRQNAVRYVILTQGLRLDYAGRREQALVQAGRLSYLHLVAHPGPFRIYAVKRPTALASGTATVTALGPNSINLTAGRAGATLLRVHFTPYWRLSGAPGCVAPAGEFTRVLLRRAGPVRLVIAFALDRIGERMPRCTASGS